jgi:hypothetical protein
MGTSLEIPLMMNTLIPTGGVIRLISITRVIIHDDIGKYNYCQNNIFTEPLFGCQNRKLVGNLADRQKVSEDMGAD